MRTPTLRILSTLTLLATLLLIPTTGLAATPEPADSERIDSDRIDAWVADRMRAHDLPGVAVAVVRGGETVHLRGYGSADPTGRPVTPDTPFLIGSASKPFTANVIRQLVTEGALSLDEPVLPHLDHLVDTPPEGFESVTIRHLLTHTAGIDMAVGLPGTVPIRTSEEALERRVADLLEHPLTATPGERYEYSNAGYALLGAVVEQVTGQRFDEVLRERILEPLGMTDTFALEGHPAAARTATGHRQWFGRWRPVELPFDRAGVAYGYLGSTAEDLATFLHAHLDGGSSLVPATADQLAEDPIEATGWDLPLERGQGLGWMVDELGDHRVVSHAGSLGHVTTHLIMAPDADGLGIAVSTNASAFIAAGHDAQYDLSVGLAELLLDEEPTPARYSTLLVFVAPLTLWALLLGLIGMISRYVGRTLPRWRGDGLRTSRGRRFWVRHVVLPTGGYLVVGAALILAMPLGAARHFYPDVGWAATAIAGLAIAWGLLRPLLTLAVLATAPATIPPTRHPDSTDPPPGPHRRVPLSVRG